MRCGRRSGAAVPAAFAAGAFVAYCLPNWFLICALCALIILAGAAAFRR